VRAEARLDGSRVHSNGSNTHLASSTERSTRTETDIHRALELNFRSVLFNFSRHQSVAAGHWKSFFAELLTSKWMCIQINAGARTCLCTVCVWCVAYGTIVLWLLCCDRDRQRCVVGWSVLAGRWVLRPVDRKSGLHRCFRAVSILPPRRSPLSATVPVTHNYSAYKAPAGRRQGGWAVQPFRVRAAVSEKPIVPFQQRTSLNTLFQQYPAVAHWRTTGKAPLPNAIVSS